MRKRITDSMRRKVFEMHGGRCYLCGHEIKPGREWDVEHVIPVALGGTNDLDNLRPAHKSCHRLKTKDDMKAIRKVKRIREGRKPKPWLWKWKR